MANFAVWLYLAAERQTTLFLIFWLRYFLQWSMTEVGGGIELCRTVLFKSRSTIEHERGAISPKGAWTQNHCPAMLQRLWRHGNWGACALPWRGESWENPEGLGRLTAGLPNSENSSVVTSELTSYLTQSRKWALISQLESSSKPCPAPSSTYWGFNCK